MKPVLSAIVALAALVPLRAADKPRVFVTESGAAQVKGEASGPEVKGSLSFAGGTSPQSIEVMKQITRRCPGVTVTSNRDKADFVLRLDHEEINPTTPFVHGNKVALFDRNDDLIYTTTTHLLGSAVKDACSAIASARR